MQVKLEFITPNAEAFIGKMAAICYDANTSEEACVKRAKHCVDKGHLSTLRFANATFNISGISRVCSHQLVRHKFLDYLQRSQRYCKEDSSNIIPESLQKYVEVYEAIQYTHSLYNELLRQGVKKEDARFVLTQSCTTELNVTGSLQAWLDFIKLRSDKHAQYEIKVLAVTINNILAKECPNLFKEMSYD